MTKDTRASIHYRLSECTKQNDVELLWKNMLRKQQKIQIHTSVKIISNTNIVKNRNYNTNKLVFFKELLMLQLYTHLVKMC